MSIRGKVSHQSLLLGGFAFQTAWIFVAFWRPLQTGLGSIEASGPVAGSSFFSGLAICAIYLIFGCLFRPLQKAVERDAWMLFAVLLMAAGSIGRVLAETSTAAADICDLAAHAASAFLLLCWLRAFADFDSDTILKTIPCILASFLLVSVMVAAVLPYSRLMLLVALPPVCAGSLAYERRKAAAVLVDQNSAARGPLLKISICTLLISFLVGILCGLGRFVEKSIDASQFYLFFLLMIGGILLVLSATTFYRDYLITPASTAEFPTFLTPALIAALASAWLSLLLGANLELVANCFGRSCLELALMVMFLIVAHHYRSSALQIFSFGQAMFLAGGLPGTYALLRSLGIEEMPLGNIGVIILLLACTSLLVFGMVFIIVNRDFMVIIRSCIDDEPVPAADPASAEPSAADTLAIQYHLSEREHEVLEEFSRGRSMKRIAEDLCVSVGTVNTYLRRIYQKMDIHSRQELLDMFDDLQRPDEES